MNVSDRTCPPAYAVYRARTGRDARAPRAFTLIELMLSVTLGVILMLGISQVFKMTGDAVGVGQAMSTAIREGRGAQPVLAHDFDGAVTDGAPCILLRSERRWAFRSQQDALGDRDGNPATTDLDGNNVEGEASVPGEIISPALYNYRNHRIDTFSFFARGLFHRQTGNDGVYVEDMATSDAWIWYGHLRLADNGLGAATKYQNLGPGYSGTANTDNVPDSTPLTAATNPNNFYATQWCLGRVAIVLKDKLPDGSSGIITNNGVNQHFIDRTWTNGSTPSTPPLLSPLAFGSKMDGGGTITMEQSRYDLAATDITDFRTSVQNVISANSGSPNYDWFSQLFASGTNRFYATPFVSKPITSADMAKASPIFVHSCTQFMVEYAGDFITEDASGVVATGAGAAVPDGTVDFFIDQATGGKRIRWYGFPRDIDNDGRILSQGRTNNQINSVVPLRDIIMGAGGTAGYPFEKFSVADALPAAPLADYAAAGALPPNSNYTCAWGPNDVKPKMIRITMTIDDPSGRLGDGQTFEYIFTLP